MNKWTDFLLNPEKIHWIFPNAERLLDDVELHEVTLHRDGPRATLRFNAATYPERPPKKWQIQGFNCVQIQLTLLGLCDTAILGRVGEERINFFVEKIEDRICVSGENKNVKIDLRAEFMAIDTISAYCRQ
jgi:hypothetical protein